MNKYIHISIKERESIFLMLEDGKKPAEIARSLGRDKGSLSRELKRNLVLIQGKGVKEGKNKKGLSLPSGFGSKEV